MNQRPPYGEAEAQQIIARAAEIDAERGRQLDAQSLREIATEAGISPLAVDRALQEHESIAAQPRVSWLRRHSVVIIVAVVMVVAVFAIVVTRIAVPVPIPVPPTPPLPPS